MKTVAAVIMGMLIGALVISFIFIYPMVNKQMACQDCQEKLTRCNDDLKNILVEAQAVTASDLKINAILNRNASTEANIMLNTVTMGDGSYVPINITGEAGENAEAILSAVNIFKESNPDLEIVSFQIDKRDGIPGVVPPRIYGLWILHQPSGGLDFPIEINSH